MRRFHSSRIVFALLMVLAAGPAIVTTCAILCAPAMQGHLPEAADHHASAAACHETARGVTIAAPFAGHDCRTHPGDARVVPATLTSIKKHVDAPAASPAAFAVQANREQWPAAPSASIHDPPRPRAFSQHPQFVLRI